MQKAIKKFNQSKVKKYNYKKKIYNKNSMKNKNKIIFLKKLKNKK